jgi:hypothetical protein
MQNPGAPRTARRARREFLPSAFVLLNAVAFVLVRPGVPDLWAARARASAVGHGVGLSYWFSWFGGSTPGNYSVITPYLCAKLGTELVPGAAAVTIAVLATALVRGTARPEAAACAAAFAVVVNLWCGRVPFLLGSAFAVAALVGVRRRATFTVVPLSVASVLASPIAGAFLCLGLSGLVLTARLRRYRTPAVLAIAGAGGTLVALAAVFGVPGPEPFPPYLICEILLALALMLVAAPPDHFRGTLLVAVGASVVLFVVPNGIGANFLRLALFGLPPAAVALCRRPARSLAVLLAPLLVFGALSSASALVSATQPGSSASYYAQLASELDALPTVADYRLELVGASHAAYTALLSHAALARGWETQEDLALNARLESPSLDAHSYRDWLDDNAVGYVAVNLPADAGPEARLITGRRPAYLHQIWRRAHWRLFAVGHPTPIVARPAVLTASSEAELTVHVPCACQVPLRIRWSRFLSVEPRLVAHTADDVEDTYRPTVTPSAEGWTTLTTNRAGTYVLAGSI